VHGFCATLMIIKTNIMGLSLVLAIIAGFVIAFCFIVIAIRRSIKKKKGSQNTKGTKSFTHHRQA
jgi:MFS superfamily sulfate permease-like transporter